MLRRRRLRWYPSTNCRWLREWQRLRRYPGTNCRWLREWQRLRRYPGTKYRWLCRPLRQYQWRADCTDHKRTNSMHIGRILLPLIFIEAVPVPQDGQTCSDKGELLQRQNNFCPNCCELSVSRTPGATKKLCTA